MQPSVPHILSIVLLSLGVFGRNQGYHYPNVISNQKWPVKKLVIANIKARTKYKINIAATTSLISHLKQKNFIIMLSSHNMHCDKNSLVLYMHTKSITIRVTIKSNYYSGCWNKLI